MTILFCGGRTYANREAVRVCITSLLERYGSFRVVHGAQSGADTLAGEVAFEMGLDVAPYPMRREAFAGPRRNARMLREEAERGTPVDLVVWFPGGPGTANMQGKALLAGIALECGEGQR